ncbi:MAG: hypothetical protein ABI416_05545 [Ginsengibacter sp.]
MKKWMVATVVILGLGFTSVYLFFPKVLNITNMVKIHCNINSINRLVMPADRWAKWWPGKIEHDSVANTDIFIYRNYRYLLTGNKYNSIAIQTIARQLTIDGIIFFLPLGNDSVQVEWKYGLGTNSNPINRIHLYRESKKINSNMTGILESMKAFLEKPENVYGMHIDQERVKDTVLITTKITSNQYPSTPQIYGLISGIKNYIALNNAVETNFPMLHVWQDSGLFHTTIGIPLNRKIPENNRYTLKRMVPGKILVSQVTGGLYRTSEALRQLGIFISDNHLSSPAIPFESLVTNRMEQPDTSKWITKIYYPVF